MNKQLNIFNTLSRKKEKFIPNNKEKVGMYVCGPTVYDFPHIGNARPLVVFDVIYRLLLKLYGKEKITYVRNITDIDDKIIESSKKNNISIDELTNKITKNFQQDCQLWIKFFRIFFCHHYFLNLKQCFLYLYLKT